MELRIARHPHSHDALLDVCTSVGPRDACAQVSYPADPSRFDVRDDHCAQYTPVGEQGHPYGAHECVQVGACPLEYPKYDPRAYWPSLTRRHKRAAPEPSDPVTCADHSLRREHSRMLF